MLQMDRYCKNTLCFFKNSILPSPRIRHVFGHACNFGQISDASALDDLVRNILTSAPQSGIGLSTGNLIKVSAVLINA